MSMVAERLGMAGLIACSKVMNVTTDKGKKTGVFMEQGRDWNFFMHLECSGDPRHKRKRKRVTL